MLEQVVAHRVKSMHWSVILFLLAVTEIPLDKVTLHTRQNQLMNTYGTMILLVRYTTFVNVGAGRCASCKVNALERDPVSTCGHRNTTGQSDVAYSAEPAHEYLWYHDTIGKVYYLCKCWSRSLRIV